MKRHIVLLLSLFLAVVVDLSQAQPGNGKKPPPKEEDPGFALSFLDTYGFVNNDSDGEYVNGELGVSAKFGNGGGYLLDPDADAERYFVFRFPEALEDPAGESLPNLVYRNPPAIKCQEGTCPVTRLDDPTDTSHFFGVGTVVVDDGIEISTLTCAGAGTSQTIDAMTLGDCLQVRPNFRVAWKQKKVNAEQFLRCGRHDTRDGGDFDQRHTDHMELTCAGPSMGPCDSWELRPIEVDGAERLICRLYEHLHGKGGGRTEVVGDFDVPFAADVRRLP